MINSLSTGNYLIVYYGSSRPCILEKGSEKYIKIKELLDKNVPDQEIIQALDVGAGIEKYSDGNFTVDRDAGIVFFDGQEIHNAVADRIIEFCRQNLPYQPLINFWRNIQQNPSEESKKHLFLFLEVNKMPITPDGQFLAYKKVKKDNQGNLVDCYTGTFCNNIGAVVTVIRENVDPNRQQTCSHGLHVAAYNYAAFEYSGEVLLEVKVNPSDVVAVPEDYNNQKMRVCRYEVVGINKFQEGGDRSTANPIKKALVQHSEIRAKRKMGENLQKAEKAKLKEEHQALISSLKDTHKGGQVLLSGLTAAEIVDVVKTLTNVNIMKGLKDMKNKEAIIKRAKAALIDSGFYA